MLIKYTDLFECIFGKGCFRLDHYISLGYLTHEYETSFHMQQRFLKIIMME